VIRGGARGGSSFEFQLSAKLEREPYLNFCRCEVTVFPVYGGYRFPLPVDEKIFGVRRGQGAMFRVFIVARLFTT
jgi:hypothetical protein